MAALKIQAPEAARFTAGRYFGVLTVRDSETDMVVSHAATWDEDIARFVAAELTEQPRRVALFDWEMRGQ